MLKKPLMVICALTLTLAACHQDEASHPTENGYYDAVAKVRSAETSVTASGCKNVTSSYSYLSRNSGIDCNDGQYNFEQKTQALTALATAIDYLLNTYSGKSISSSDDYDNDKTMTAEATASFRDEASQARQALTKVADSQNLYSSKNALTQTELQMNLKKCFLLKDDSSQYSLRYKMSCDNSSYTKSEISSTVEAYAVAAEGMSAIAYKSNLTYDQKSELDKKANAARDYLTQLKSQLTSLN